MRRSDIPQDRDPKLSARAAPSLAESDLLMISLRDERPLPAKIRAPPRFLSARSAGPGVYKAGYSS